LIAAGLLGFATLGTAVLTFILAFTTGFAFTVGPLMQDGVPAGLALGDSLLTETPSIAIIEIVAMGVAVWLSGAATARDTLFWSSLVVSVACGLLVTYPVNLWLIAHGVKEGLMDLRVSGESARQNHS
jgi:hypothetical protein